MFNFDVLRYEKAVNGAIALRQEIETAADEISKKGYDNIFFIGLICPRFMVQEQC